MMWFAIGATIGMGSLLSSLIKRPIQARSPIDAVGGFAVSGGLGALVFGTPLWLLFG
jgi:hypothetical protein